MRIRTVLMWTLLMVLLVQSGAAIARGSKKHAGGAGLPTAFAKAAAEGGMAEVQLGNLASDKAQDPDVKSFAQRMVTDHSKANDELKTLATQKSWTLPTGLATKDRTLMNRLTRLSGAAFDRAYMKMMVADHNKDVAAFQRYAERGSDPDLKDWASKTLPTLQEHQQMAKQTSSKLSGSMSASH